MSLNQIIPIKNLVVLAFFPYRDIQRYRRIMGQSPTFLFLPERFLLTGAPVALLVEHRAVMREVVSSTPAGPTLRVLK